MKEIELQVQPSNRIPHVLYTSTTFLIEYPFPSFLHFCNIHVFSMMKKKFATFFSEQSEQTNTTLKQQYRSKIL